MAKIYALQGRGNCGKTSTLKEIFNQLKAKYPNAIINIINENSDITIELNINGVKIGIESQGDPNSRLETSLLHFVSVNCDVIFCAVRTSGMTVQWVNNCSNTHNIEFIPKHSSSNEHAQTNALQATSMISLAGL
ncbi:hypothetical protein [Morganella psychrotolerans]|uniref:Uncharacterized protein n=1 Tax=Morganella psychrotolerans TaxID=368603 RepID=A0A1B8HMW0_9GAMM|nr:hypothetical protein [Morganella psychrotolerans]OBU10610.1 hypothetical protein AYY17_15855 [Morganella psychrotolerans]